MIPQRLRRAAVHAAVAVAFVVGVIVIAVGIVGSYDGEASGNRSATGALSDYRDALYQPVRALAEGINPYDHVAYFGTMSVDQELPPYFPINYLPFAPLAALPLRPAGVLFSILSISAVIATGCVVAVASRGLREGRESTGRRLDGRASVVWVAAGFAAAVMLSRAGFQSLQYGQSGPWVALCLSLGIVGMQRRSTALITVAVAAAWAKPSVGLPIAVLLSLAAGRYPLLRNALVRGTLLAWASWIPVGLLLLRTDGPVDLLRIMVEDLEFSANHPFGQLLAPSRLDVSAVLSKVAGQPVPVAVELLLSTLVLAVTGWATRRCTDPAQLWLLVVVGTLVALWRQPYDLMLALPAAVVVGLDLWNGRSPGVDRWPSAVAVGCLAVAAFSWPFGTRGGRMLGLDELGATRLSAVTGAAALASWAFMVLGVAVRHRAPGRAVSTREPVDLIDGGRR